MENDLLEDYFQIAKREYIHAQWLQIIPWDSRFQRVKLGLGDNRIHLPIILHNKHRRDL
jgi:hypothetical protein